jgi:NAD dependent epimerase/dehydratase
MTQSHPSCGSRGGPCFLFPVLLLRELCLETNDMNRILVTGADGFIGSHLVEHLVALGRPVRAFVQYNSFGHWGWLDDVPKPVQDAIEVFPGDVRDSICVKEAMKDCDAVLHLAALISIPYSYRAPDSYVETNIRGTLNVVQAARELGTQKVVVTSTSEVYGTAQFVPITEAHPLVGQSPYSASKIAADQLALSYFRSFGTPVTVIRPFNTFGPRQSTRAVIPTIITQILDGNRKLKLGSLMPRRDLTYVLDTVRGIVASLGAKDVSGEVINLGTGFDISVGDLAMLIAQLMQVEIAFEREEQRVRPAASEVERLVAHNGKAGQLLGWRPEVAGLDGLRRGLEKSIAWFSDPENRAHYRTELYAI